MSAGEPTGTDQLDRTHQLDRTDQLRRLHDDHATVLTRRSPGALEATVLRTGDAAGLDLLSHLATTGACTTYRELTDAVAGLTVPVDDLDPAWLPRLALTVALRSVRRPDPNALHLIRWVLRLPACRPHVTEAQAGTFAQVLFRHGRSAADVERALQRWPVPPGRRAAIEADARNPHGTAPRAWRQPTSDAVWVARFGTAIGWTDELTVTPGDGPAFDRLTVHADDTTPLHGGPLITVIVPTYRPDHGLLTSVRSLLDGRWQAVEILVVDDGSGAGADAIFAAVAALDPRVRVVRLPDNRGTYAARNAGLVRARGTLIAFQDADDRSHPDRLAAQVQPLLDDPDLVATTSRAALATDDLDLVRVGYNQRADNASSLLFRADLVTTTLGGFDPVRRGGDTEFALRLQAAFGPRSIRRLSRTLALVRKRSTSLSGDDFAPGWRHRARQHYRSAYTDWHATARRTSDLHLDPDGTRPFPAPRRTVERVRDVRRRYDVVLVGDWQSYGGPQRSMLEEAAALRRAGRRVAVADLEPLRFVTTRRRPLCDAVRRAIADGDVDLVLWDDPTDVDLTVLRYPPLLQFPPDDPPAWRTERVWIVVNQPPTEGDGSDLRYLPPDVDAHARRLFGVTPAWVPQGPVARAALTPWADQLRIAPRDDVGVLDLDAWWTDKTPDPHGPVRIARHSRDHVMKYPADGDTLLRVYGDPRFEVTMLGAATTVPALLGDRPVPDTWTLHPQDAIEVPDLLAAADVVVYHDHPARHEAFGRAVLEAAASGCLTVLPPRYEATFGDAATYATPDEVVHVVLTHHRDPQLFAAATQRAKAELQRRFSYDAFVDLVDDDAGLADLPADLPTDLPGQAVGGADPADPPGVDVRPATPPSRPRVAPPAPVPTSRTRSTASVPSR